MRRATPAALLASLLAAAIVGGAVGAGVTVGILRLQARSNPQTAALGGALTVGEDATTASVAQKAVPAVVSIVTRESNLGHGSGFLFTNDGFVVTNVGVVANAQTLAVLINADSRRHDARIVDFDCETGLAVLKVDQVSNLPTLGFGDSTGLKLGQGVVAVGGSLSDAHSVTRGIVSAVHRTVTISAPSGGAEIQLGNAIQTDAQIVPSISGGPLLNTGAQVIGLTMTGTNQSQPVGFALPASDLQPEVEQIIQAGQLVVASLGVQTANVRAEEAAIRGGVAGARLTGLTAGGPGERAGLKPGDVIVQLDDQRLDDAHPLAQVLRSRFKPNQKVTVTYARGGSTNQLQLTLRGERPACP